jgi:hypothetical protein
MPHIIRLELELDTDGQPIAGVLWTPNLPNRAFDGWLELASAIEDARRHGSLDTIPPEEPSLGAEETP